MNILFVAPRYHTNQVPIMEYLVKNNHVVHFLAYRKEYTEDHRIIEPQLCHSSILYKLMEFCCFRRNTNSIYRENFKISKFIPSCIWLVKYILSIHPDVVVIRDKKKSSSLVYFICLLCRVQHILLYTQDPCFISKESRENRIKRFIKKIIYPKKIYSPVKYKEIKPICCSIATGYCFIPFAMNFDVSIVNQRCYLQGNKINILDVGKYRDYKNHFVLAKAIALLPISVRNELRITVVGQARSEEEKKYRQKLEAFIFDRNMKDNFVLKESIPYSQMADVYLQNDVFILTSKVETASISVIEAMKYGNVCISTNRNGTASYIQSDLGFIFESDNENSLKDVLIEIYNKKECIPELGRRTFEFASNNYSTEVYFDKLQMLINE